MPEDRDPAEFLRSRGVHPPSQGGAPAAPKPYSPPPNEAPSEAPAPTPTDTDPGRERRAQIIHEEQANDPDYPGGRAFYQGLTQTAFGAGRLIAPGTLEHLAQQYPLVKQAQEFANEQNPEETWGQWFARQAGATLPFMATPLGIESLFGKMGAAAVGRMPARYLPRTKQFIRTPKQKLVQRTAKGVGRGAETAARGAAAGAVADPEHPGAGAAGGAVAGALPSAVGATLQSPAGRWFGSHMLPYAVAHGAAEAGSHLGIPRGWTWGTVAPNILWYHSPMGRSLRVVGENIIDSTGAIIGRIPSGVTGYETGPTVGQTAQ